MDDVAATTIDVEVPWGIEIVEDDDDWLISFRWDARNTHKNPTTLRFLFGVYFVLAFLVLLGLIGVMGYSLLIEFNELLFATVTLLGLPPFLGIYLNACRCFFPLIQRTTIRLDPGQFRVERTVFGLPLPAHQIQDADEDDWKLGEGDQNGYRDLEVRSSGWRDRKSITIHSNEKQATWIRHMLKEVV